jgi:serine/threonine protein kinase
MSVGITILGAEQNNEIGPSLLSPLKVAKAPASSLMAEKAAEKRVCRPPLRARRGISLDMQMCFSVPPTAPAAEPIGPGIFSKADGGGVSKILVDASAVENGTQFNKYYELEMSESSKVGTGTFANVYRAKCCTTSCAVAVKRSRSNDRSIVKVLREEHAILSSLSHPNIVRVDALFDSPTEGVSICMELCEDGNVEQYVNSLGLFTQELATRLVYQLLLGLSYLHKQRVVHRDVKPENLLLTSKDGSGRHGGKNEAQINLKIGDFGSARRLSDMDGDFMLSPRGTPLYSAPEIIFGLDYKEGVDIWACGLCLHFMITGKLPFCLESKRVRDQLEAGITPELTSKKIQGTLKEALQQCLIAKTADRPQAAELLMHPLFVEEATAASQHMNEKKPQTFESKRA